MPDDPGPDSAEETKPAVPASDPLVIPGDAMQLALADPDTLVQGLRYLQQRIPGFVQLSIEEERSLTRVSSLDPEFVEAGIRAGRAWKETKQVTGLSGEELRDVADEIRRWDEFESELRVLLKGVVAGNRKRRYRLGEAILNIYAILGKTINREGRKHLRPHYEEMKRASLRSRKRSRKGTKTEEKPDSSPGD